MVVSKIYCCNAYNINEVITELAKEIDNGYIVDYIEQDGSIVIYHNEYEPLEKAAKMIEAIAKVAKVGEIYDGKVTRIEAYGAFVEIFPNCEGLVHVSKLAHERVEHPKDILKLNDTIKVIVTGIDEKGKVSLSRKELLPKPPKPEKVKPAE